MASQLSGIAIILFIAFGSVTFILLFIFAKRQITRFALRSRRGPHATVGTGAPKSLCREIDRRLNLIEQIRSEPWLLNSTNKHLFKSGNDISQLSPTHLYRMKAVDDVKELCHMIRAENIAKSRHIQEDVLQYFIRLHRNNVFTNIDIQVLYKFLSLYEHARYQDEVFSYKKYCEFSYLLQSLKKNFMLSSNCKECETTANDLQFEESPDANASAEPLLIKSFSPSLNSINQKFTHETTV